MIKSEFYPFDQPRFFPALRDDDGYLVVPDQNLMQISTVLSDLEDVAVGIAAHLNAGIRDKRSIITAFEQDVGTHDALRASSLIDICDGRFRPMHLWTQSSNGLYALRTH